MKTRFAVWSTLVAFLGLSVAPGQSANSYYGTNGAGTGGYFDLPSSSSLPAGAIIMWSGTIATIPSGYVICDGNNGTPNLLGSFIKGVATAATNPGATGGSATHTPAGTVSAPTFAGAEGTTSAVSAGTPAGTNGNTGAEATHTHGVTSNVSGTVTPAGTVAWPVGVPVFTGNAVTAASTTNGTKLVTNNTSTGVSPITTATGTVAWPAGVPTFTGSTNQAVTMVNNAVTSGAGSSHLHSGPTFSGSALGTHTHTLTPAGTNSTPTFTGSSANTEPVYYAIAFIMKT